MYNVLFLCSGNSARSIMGEAILNQIGIGKFKAYSAGSHPRGEVHPITLDLLQRMNYSTEGLSCKDWSVFSEPDAPAMDFVFTVCDKTAAEVCPEWPGQPMTAHWSIPDPLEVEGTELERVTAFRDAYRQLYNRLNIFINLPIHSLDALTLQQHLENLGNGDSEASEAA